MLKLVSSADLAAKADAEAPGAPIVGISEPVASVADAAVADDRLVALVLGGDRDAFEALYRRHAPFAINLAVRLQGSRNDVEDLVHDAFLKAHQRLAQLREPAAFRSWLGSILVSLVRSRLRRARWFRGFGLGAVFGGAVSAQESVDLESIASTSAGPDLRAELAQVYALLRLLPADERIAWTLRSVERHRLEEVASMTDCSLATVKRRIQRAQSFLDEHFVSAGAPDTIAASARGGTESEAPTSQRAPRRRSRRAPIADSEQQAASPTANDREGNHG